VAGYHDQSSQIFLFGVKFVVLVIDSWVLWWVCVCHFALRICGEDPARATIMTPRNRWIANGGFAIMALWPIIPVFCVFYRANEEYINISNTMRPVVKSLLHLAPSYSPSTYEKFQLLRLLLPASRAADHLNSLLSNIRIGFSIYLAAGSISCLFHIPVLVLVFSSLSDRTTAKMLASSNQSFKRLRKERQAIALATSLAYVTLLSSLLVLGFALKYTGHRQLFSSNWWAFLEIGLHAPVAIVANLDLFLVHLLDRSLAPTSKQLQEASMMVRLSEDKLDE